MNKAEYAKFIEAVDYVCFYGCIYNDPDKCEVCPVRESVDANSTKE